MAQRLPIARRGQAGQPPHLPTAAWLSPHWPVLGSACAQGGGREAGQAACPHHPSSPLVLTANAMAAGPVSRVTSSLAGSRSSHAWFRRARVTTGASSFSPCCSGQWMCSHEQTPGPAVHQGAAVQPQGSRASLCRYPCGLATWGDVTACSAQRLGLCGYSLQR